MEKRNSSTSLLSVAALLLLMHASGSVGNVETEDVRIKGMDAALGIHPAFGLWDSTITLVYDPDGAPPVFANVDEVLDLLEQAAEEWSLVSGIEFSISSADSEALEDDSLPLSAKDGLTRVYWTDIGDDAGRAGPDFNFYDFDKGYFPYFDGSVQLSEDPEIWENSPLKAVLVHELGHLMGLGHSNDPDSVMYAFPYNFLRHPRPDDILAARALYGSGTLQLNDVYQPVRQWLFAPPPLAPASATADLFKANAFLDQGFFIGTAPDQPYTSVTASADDDALLWFYAAIGPSMDEAINLNTSIVITDPFGYIYNELIHIDDCEVGVSCAIGSVIELNKVVKSIPGEWAIYVVDNDTETTLHEFTFDVNTTTEINQPPVATFMDVVGTSYTSADVTLTVSDPDSDTVNVIWHQQGDLGDVDKDDSPDTSIVDTVPSGTTITREVRFAASLEQTLFVELTDGDPRYASDAPDASTAGAGFQSLIAFDLQLPVFTSDDIRIRTSFASGGDSGDSEYFAALKTIASSLNLELVTTNDGSATNAQFGAGASSDSGETTSSTFVSGDEIIIAGSVTPQAEDVGTEGEIYVVLVIGNSLSYLGLDGNYNDWNGSLKTLQPAFERDALKLTETFEVFSGNVEGGLYRVFMGYKRSDGGPLHFNSEAFRLDVEEELGGELEDEPDGVPEA